MKQLRFIILFFTILPLIAHAFSWPNWLLTDDQRAARAMQSAQYEKAATLFTSLDWQGTAYYRAGYYDKALERYNESKTALAAYNRGNTLAKLGDYQGAISAYEEALAKQPDFEDAAFNKKLLENLPQSPSQESQASAPTPPEQTQQPKPASSKEDSSAKQQAQSHSQSTDSTSASEQQSPQTKDQPQTMPNSQSKEQTSTTYQQPQSTSATEKQPQTTSPTEAKNNKLDDKSAPAEPNSNPLTKQQQELQDQQLEQALQSIPDDPGGLLKQKFRRDHQRMLQESL